MTMIKFFKKKSVKLSTLVFTGLLFLNMSFFLAEVAALELTKNKKIAENITKLWMGVAEEEKDTAGSEKETDNLKELDLTFNAGILHCVDRIFVALLSFSHQQSSKPDSGITTLFNPPPEA